MRRAEEIVVGDVYLTQHGTVYVALHVDPSEKDLLIALVTMRDDTFTDEPCCVMEWSLSACLQQGDRCLA